MDFMCIWIDYVLVYYGIYEILEILVLDFFLGWLCRTDERL